MKNLIFFGSLLLLITITSIQASCLDDEKKNPLEMISAKIDENDSEEDGRVEEFFKNVGCNIKKGATKVKEGAKKLSGKISEKAKDFGEKAKTFGTDVKTKIGEWKEKLSGESDEAKTKSLFSNVELINPDILKVEQKCGHGHILDSLGNCNKL